MSGFDNSVPVNGQIIVVGGGDTAVNAAVNEAVRNELKELIEQVSNSGIGVIMT